MTFWSANTKNSFRWLSCYFYYYYYYRKIHRWLYSLNRQLQNQVNFATAKFSFSLVMYVFITRYLANAWTRCMKHIHRHIALNFENVRMTWRHVTLTMQLVIVSRSITAPIIQRSCIPNLIPTVYVHADAY